MQQKDIEAIVARHDMHIILVKDVGGGGIQFQQVYIANDKRRVSLGRLNKLCEMTEQQLEERIAAKLNQ